MLGVAGFGFGDRIDAAHFTKLSLPLDEECFALANGASAAQLALVLTVQALAIQAPLGFCFLLDAGAASGVVPDSSGAG